MRKREKGESEIGEGKGGGETEEQNIRHEGAGRREERGGARGRKGDRKVTNGAQEADIFPFFVLSPLLFSNNDSDYSNDDDDDDRELGMLYERARSGLRGLWVIGLLLVVSSVSANHNEWCIMWCQTLCNAAHNTT